MKPATLMRYIRPISFFRSDAELRKRLAEKTLTSRDILEIEYGHFPPNGINVKSPNTKPVHIKPYWQDKEASPITRALLSFLTLGYVRRRSWENPQTDENRTIYFNYLASNPVAHGLDGYNVASLAAAFKTFIASMSFSKMPYVVVIGLTSLRQAPFVRMITLPFQPVTDTIGHEHIHLLQNDSDVREKTIFNAFDNEFREEHVKDMSLTATIVNLFDSAYSFGLVNYMAADYEVQARLHTTMTYGYKRWGRLPETREELWAALIDSGLNAPEPVLVALADRGKPGIADFLRPGLSGTFNRVANNLIQPHIAELNVACRAHYSQASKIKFWEQTLPYLYGHLLELYGDPNGLTKVGLMKSFSRWGSMIPAGSRITDRPDPSRHQP